MAIKKLQNNFTTPEQSERLLELGVPKWTADCYYEGFPKGIRVKPSPFFVPSDPCWSAGQLIEIWEVITGEKWLHETEQPIIEELISNFNYYSYDNDDPLDFSKLEE